MSYGNYLQGSIDSTNNAYNVLLSGAPSGYTSSGLNIGGDTTTMYGVKLSKDATNNAYLDVRADMSNKMSLRYKDNSSGTVSSMLDLVNDSALSSTSSYGATVNGRVKASSYYSGSIDTRAPVNTGVYQGYDGNVGYFNINKGSGTGGFSFKTYNSDGSMLQSNLNLLASGVVQAAYYTATGNAADSEAVSMTGIDASGNLVRNYTSNARFRALEARATAIESDLTGGVPTKVNEIISRINGLNFFSQNIATIAVFTPSPSNPTSTPTYYSPQLTSLASNTWTTNGINWTSSMSSSDWYTIFGYMAFDNSTSDSWQSAILYSTANGSYSGSVSTVVQSPLSSTMNGEWLQLQSSTPLIMASYTCGCGAPNNFPSNYYILGSNDASNWYPIQHVVVGTNPFQSYNSLLNSYITISSGSQTVGSGVLNTTSYSTSSNAYTYFRLVGLSSSGNNTSNGNIIEFSQWNINFVKPTA
jgi:hypothetical protein